MFKVKILSLVLVLAIALVGCTNKDIRKASVAIRDVAVTLEKAQEGFQVAHDQGYVSNEDYRVVQGYFGDIASSGKEAVAAIRVAKDKPTALKALDQMLVSTDNLLNDGVLRVKNDQTRQALTALILSLRAAIVTATAFLS